MTKRVEQVVHETLLDKVCTTKVEDADCGIFVRNEKKVQLNFPHHRNTVAGVKFKTFGKALKMAHRLGFRTYVNDDDIVHNITPLALQLANR